MIFTLSDWLNFCICFLWCGFFVFDGFFYFVFYTLKFVLFLIDFLNRLLQPLYPCSEHSQVFQLNVFWFFLFDSVCIVLLISTLTKSYLCPCFLYCYKLNLAVHLDHYRAWLTFLGAPQRSSFSFSFVFMAFSSFVSKLVLLAPIFRCEKGLLQAPPLMVDHTCQPPWRWAAIW